MDRKYPIVFHRSTPRSITRRNAHHGRRPAGTLAVPGGRKREGRESSTPTEQYAPGLQGSKDTGRRAAAGVWKETAPSEAVRPPRRRGDVEAALPYDGPRGGVASLLGAQQEAPPGVPPRAQGGVGRDAGAGLAKTHPQANPRGWAKSVRRQTRGCISTPAPVGFRAGFGYLRI